MPLKTSADLLRRPELPLRFTYTAPETDFVLTREVLLALVRLRPEITNGPLFFERERLNLGDGSALISVERLNPISDPDSVAVDAA